MIQTELKSLKALKKGFTQHRFFLQKKSGAGFTLVEILVAISILSGLFLVSFFSYGSLRNTTSLEKNISQIQSFFQEAKSQAVSGKDDASYGIKIFSNKLVEFKNTYASTTASNVTLSFTDITLSAISITGGGSEILFAKNSGIPSTSGSFLISLNGNSAKNATITIRTTGGIE